MFPLNRVLLRLVEQIVMFGGIFPQDRVQRRSVEIIMMMMSILRTSWWRSVTTTGSPWLMTGGSTSGTVATTRRTGACRLARFTGGCVFGGERIWTSSRSRRSGSSQGSTAVDGPVIMLVLAGGRVKGLASLGPFLRAMTSLCSCSTSCSSPCRLAVLKVPYLHFIDRVLLQGTWYSFWRARCCATTGAMPVVFLRQVLWSMSL